MRAAARLKRESYPAAQLSSWSRLIQERVLGFSPYRESRSVALYSPVGNEVATEMVRDDAFRTGKRVFYPKLSRRGEPALVRVESLDEFVRGRYGILEPTGDEVLGQEDREGLVVFVPGLAFDARGNRLGRGGGWYDRALELLGEKPVLVGLAYEFQISEELPVETWDRKVHFVITESRLIECRMTPAFVAAKPTR